MTSQDILLIITTLLGGCNIFQFIFLRQERKKRAAEASAEEAEAQRKHFELDKDKADYLIERLDRVQKDYLDVQEEMRKKTSEYTIIIGNKCNEIADLKSQVLYLKRLRCYDFNCKARIPVNPDKKQKADIKQ